jgi:hypothetical protein
MLARNSPFVVTFEAIRVHFNVRADFAKIKGFFIFIKV